MKKILVILLFAAASLVAAPKAIIFDFGGVLTGEQKRGVVVDFIRGSLQISQEEYEAACLVKRLFIIEGGSDGEFWCLFAETKGICLEPGWNDSFQAVLKEAIGVNPQMFALVEELKEKEISVGLLSNIDERLANLIRGFGLYDLFDPCLLSCEIGVEKPDQKAYWYLLKKLEIPAEEVVFIDDRLENIEAAKQVGLDAILFESEERLREELSQRGVFVS